MSKTVDERIVSMQFDNKQFESGIQTSINSIDKLKTSLNFSGVEKGFDNLNSAAKGVNLEPLANGVEAVKEKFSALEVMAITALVNITNRAVDAGVDLVKSLSIDQVTAGWSKYGEKTQSVQTIMAATAKDFEDTEEQMEFVNEQLDKLNWFTDETSYNFLDMVNNIGKFTSNGVKLDDAVTSMQGISTWAAVSGANASEASRAMYNLSQALAVGTVKLQDWKSIENANMATLEFKETVIQAAVECGMLADAGDGMYKTMEGGTVSATNFNQALSDGWFTSEVLLKSLDKYGGFTNKLNDAYVALGDGVNYTTSEIIEMIDQYKDKSLDMDKVMAKTGLSSEELTKMFDELGDAEYDLGRKSFAAAQEAKTFEEAINATKDAVSTGWMNTFEIIFGDYEKAKTLWTTVANELYDVFAESGNARNEMLRGWAELGGRDSMLNAISNSWEGLKAILDLVKQSFRDVFPAMTSERLFSLTKVLEQATEKFRTFANALKLLNGEELELEDENAVMSSGMLNTVNKLQSVFRGFFSVVSIGINAVKTLIGGIASLAHSFGFIGTNILDAAGAFGDWLTRLKDSAEESNIFAQIVDRIVSVMDKLANKLKEIKKPNLFNFKMADFSGLLSLLQRAWSILKKLGSVIAKLGSTIGEALKNAFKSGDLTALTTLINSLLLGGVFAQLNMVLGTLGKAKTALKEFAWTLEDYQLKLKAEALMQIAKAILILAASLLIISLIDPGQMLAATAAITALFLNLTAALKSMSSTGTGLKNAMGLSIMMTMLSVAILNLAIALRIIGGMENDDLLRGVVGLTAIVAVLVAAVAYLGEIGKYSRKMVSGAVSLIVLSIAVGNLAIVCRLMKNVNLESIGKMGLVLVEALAASAILGVIGRYSKRMIRGATSLVILGYALAIMANVCKKMSDVSVKSMVKTGLILSEMIGAAIILGAIGRYSRKMISGATSIVILGAAMEIAANVCKKVDGIRIEAIIKTGIILSSLVSAAVVLGIIGRYSKKIIRSSIALTVMAAAMEIVADVCSQFDSISLKGIIKANIAIASFIGVMIAFTSIAGQSPKVLLAAASLFIMASALRVLIPVFEHLGAMKVGSIAKAILSIASAILIIGVVAGLVGVLSPAIMMTAVAFAALGIASLALATSLLSFTTAMSTAAVIGSAGAYALVEAIKIILKGLIDLIPFIVDALKRLIMSVLDILLEAVPKICSAVVTIVSAVLDVLTELVPKILDFLIDNLPKLFEFLNELYDQFSNFIDTNMPKMFNTFSSFVMRLLELVKNAMPQIFAVIQTAMDNLVILIDTNMPTLFRILSDFVDNLLGFIEEKVPKFVELTLKIILSILHTIEDNIEEITTTAIGIVIAFIDGITQKLPDIIQAAFDLIISFVDGLATAIDENTDRLLDAIEHLFDSVVEAAIKVITRSVSKIKSEGKKFVESGFLEGVQEKIGAVKTKFDELVTSAIQKIKDKFNEMKLAAKEFITNFIDGMGEKLTDIKNKVGELIRAAVDKVQTFRIEMKSKGELLISNLITGMGNKLTAIKDKAESLVTSAISKIKEKFNDMTKAGEYLIDGLKEGIQNALSSVVDAASDLAGDVVSAFKDFFKIKSPSRVMMEIGGYISEGMAIGIEDEGDSVNNAVMSLSEDAVDGAKTALSAMSDALSSNVDVTPTIKPVVDLGNVNASGLKVDGSIDASIGKPVNALSRIVSDAQADINMSNNEVISAINTLRSELAAYYSSDGQEIALYVDSTKMASSLARPMNRQLNILSRREAY